jgi:NADPH2:quinone reductase
MRAILMTDVGPADVLQLAVVDEPQISSPTQIKVRLKAASVNPVDTKLRNRGLFYPDALPAILGCDGAGEVVETGDKVTRFMKGDDVWFCHGGLGAAPGNYAEYTVLDEKEAEIKPARISYEQAAALPLVAITAWEALFDRAGLKARQTVLIHAGAGGVGHVAIQLAKSAGARVCTTVSTDEKAKFVKRLGADKVIRYQNSDFVEEVMKWTNGEGVDVVLDSVGGEIFQRSMSAAKVYGHVNTLLDPGTDIDWKEARNRNLSISFTLMLTPALMNLAEARRRQGKILHRCAKLITDFKLKATISDVLPLKDAAVAHQMIEQGHVEGKIVLSI